MQRIPGDLHFPSDAPEPDITYRRLVPSLLWRLFTMIQGYRDLAGVEGLDTDCLPNEYFVGWY